jgi:DNA polymerase III subunit epsilon
LLKNLNPSQFVGSRSIEPLHGLLSSRCFCTCQIAKRLLPDLPSRAIRALCGYFGLTISEEKRAAGHVEATFFIWQKLVERLSASGVDNLGELSEFLCRPLVKAKAKAKGKPMYELPIDRLKRLELPDSPGIYRMLSSTGKILYVGKATSLRSRVNSYFRGRKKDSKTKELIAQIYDIDIEPTETPLEACLRETDEIKKHNPPYNRALRERGRWLVFYDRDFSQPGAEQDERFRLGPFISETLTPLLKLRETLVQKQYDPALFWNLADEAVVSEGCALFVADYLTEGEEPSVRSLLALGMAIYRAEVNERLRLLAEQEALSLLPLPPGESADSSDTESEEPEEEDEEDEEEESVVDALAIEEMIVGLLVRSARALRQSRRLTALLSSRIVFEDRGVKRLLVVRGGQVEVFAPKSRVKALSKAGGLPWQGLGLDTYDRMRVLSTELARVGALNLRMQIVD